jgi:hypothetical protein
LITNEDTAGKHVQKMKMKSLFPFHSQD